MKTGLSTLVTLAMAGLCCVFSARSAEPPRSRHGDNSGFNAVLKAVVPRELDLFNQANSKGANLQTAEAVLNLVNTAHRKLLTYNRVNPQGPRSDAHLRAEEACLYAWQKAIQTWKKADDEAVRVRIMTAWNDGLKETPEVSHQIDALWEEWDPAFMTDSFIKLFKATNDPNIVGSFIMVFGDYGQDAEDHLLREKLATILGRTDSDQMNIENMYVALKRIGYWRKGDTLRAGPASVEHDKIEALKAVAPKEYGIFSEAAAKGASDKAAEAVISLIEATDQELVAYYGGVPRTETNWMAPSAYMYAWEQAVQTWKKTSDDTVRANIIAAWDSRLKESREVKWQLHALGFDWPHAFLTGSFTRLFIETSDPATDGAFIQALEWGGKDAETLLKAKRDSITCQGKADKESIETIEAINLTLKEMGKRQKRTPDWSDPAAALSH